MKSRTRQVLSTALITSMLSILIGGFAVYNSYLSEISLIDRHMDQVAADVRNNPIDAVSVALLSIEKNNYDFTLAFQTPEGEVTILKESLGTPISGKNLRVRAIPIQEGEQLLLSTSLMDINKSRSRNLWTLLFLIIAANVTASALSSIISRSGALAQERAQRARMQEFLGDAAHELRTPMTVVKGYAELLQGKKLDEVREKAAYDRLNSELKRMDLLISDLLLLAQLGEEGAIETDVVNLTQLLNENIEDFREISPERSIVTEIEESIELVGSEKHLRRFIQNALTNIRLHTPAGTTVRISSHADKEIALVIEDSGPGLPEQSYGEKIRGLKRFDRSRSRDTGGTGLGMSIMSAVIERHNGTFSLRKSALGGLAIEVRLPRA